MQKLLFIVLAIAVNFGMNWYAHAAGKVPDSGLLLGWHYDSQLISSTLQTLKYVWFFILANIVFTYCFKIQSFDSFLVTMILWIASAPVAALIYNVFVLKQPLNWLYGVGILLVFAGSVCVGANQELLDLIKK